MATEGGRRADLGSDDGHGSGQDARGELLDHLVGLLPGLAHVLHAPHVMLHTRPS